MRVRDATEADVVDIAALYGHYVLHGSGSFEYAPPPPSEMAARLRAVKDHGLPYLVAEVDGRFAGYAAATPFRPRTGYRFTVEDSVYVAPDAQRQGVGRALLNMLISRCESLGLRQMVAVIGDSANESSVKLHRACGFEDVGVFRQVGWKHEQWLDIVMMQRALGKGGDAPPTADGLQIVERYGR